MITRPLPAKLVPTRDNNVTFNESTLTSEKTSRSSSRVGSEIEGPYGIIKRNEEQSYAPDDDMPPVEAMRSLSVAEEPNLRANDDEPNWPKDWRAYTCLFGGFLLMFNSWGIVNAYGTYASYYMQHLLPGQDIMLLNLIGSTQSGVVLFFSAIVGRFLDAGYSKHLICLGSLLIVAGSFSVSGVNGPANRGDGNYVGIWGTQGLLTGFGMACFFVSSSQVVATWFKKKKGFAIGCVASGASIAGLVYPMMIKFLIAEVGFNNAQRYTSTLTAVTCLLACLIANPNPKQQFRKPESWANWRIFVDTQAFQNPSFAWLCAAISFLFFGFYAVFFNLEEWAAATGLGYKDETPAPVDIGLSREVPKDAIRTFWLLAIMNATSTVGRLSSAWLCDMFGALNVHAVVTLIASLLVLLLWTLAKNLAAAIGFVVVFGMFSGAVIGLPPASVAYILGPDPAAQAKLGQWTGMMYSCAAACALTGPLIAGHLITKYEQNYITVQLWSGVCMLISAFCMGMAIFYKRRSRARTWISSQRRRFSESVSGSTAGILSLSKSSSRAVETREKEEV